LQNQNQSIFHQNVLLENHRGGFNFSDIKSGGTMQVMLIRHAESMGNREYRIQGQDDCALSVQGVEQAHSLGNMLASSSWKPTHIYSSPLQRALHTAEILRDYWATRECVPPVEQVSALTEIKNGVLEGLTWAEAQIRYPELCSQLMNSTQWFPIPGAESLAECRDRAQTVVQGWLQTHTQADRLWVISHGGFMQHLISTLMECHRSWGIPIPPTALFEIELDHQQWHTADQNRWNTHLWRIRRFNDLEHLKVSQRESLLFEGGSIAS
jgi:broad specificity phosphatase PhoE